MLATRNACWGPEMHVGDQKYMLGHQKYMLLTINTCWWPEIHVRDHKCMLVTWNTYECFLIIKLMIRNACCWPEINIGNKKNEKQEGGKKFLRLPAVKSRKNPSPPLTSNNVTLSSPIISYICTLLHIWILSVHCYEDDISIKLERIQSI